jgi:hypothetical protein
MQEELNRSRRDTVELARLRGEVSRLRNAGQELATVKAARDLATTVEMLKKRFEEMPEKKIPELQLLSTADWLEQAQHADLSSDIGVRKSLSDIRNRAKHKFAERLQGALKEFADANGGQLPTNVLQVAAHCNPPVANEILQRYYVTRSGSLTDVGENPFVKEKAYVDEEYDTFFEIGLNGATVHNLTPDAYVVRMATWAYVTNNGRMPTTMDELRSYLKGPVDEGKLEEIFRREELK